MENTTFIGFLLTVLPWGLIVIWVFYGFLAISFKGFRTRFSNFYIVESIPNVCVTIGLLGTFSGISYGLLNFDTNPDVIKESIQILLNGLKSALGTSIFGIIFSLIFSKIIDVLIGSKRIVPPVSEEFNELRELNSNLRNFSVQTMTKQEESIAHLQILNTNISEFRKEIGHTQHEAIMNSLKSILNDFNGVFLGFVEQLVEQNFDKLTASIENLTSWQVEYKKDIELVTESYRSLIDKHNEFVNKTQEWVNNLEQISGQSSRLQKIVDEFNETFSEDGNLSLILEKIKGATSDLKLVTKDFSGLVEKMNSTTSSIITTEEKVEKWTSEITKVSNTSGQIIDHLSTIQNFRIEGLNELNEEFNKRLATTFASFDSLVKTYIENIENRLN